MAISSLQDLPNIYKSEWAKFDELTKTYPITSTGEYSFTSASSGIPYSTANGGLLDIFTQLQTVLSPYLLTSSDWSDIQTNLDAKVNGSMYVEGITTGSSNSYFLNSGYNLISYTNGMRCTIVINVENTGASTINIDNIGSVPLKNSNGQDLNSGDMKQHSPYSFIYHNGDFISETIGIIDSRFQVMWGGTTAHTGNNYTISEPSISELIEGMAVSFKVDADSTGAVTLNWEGKGAYPVLNAKGAVVTNWKANGIYTVRFGGTAFILQGEGGDENLEIGSYLPQIYGAIRTSPTIQAWDSMYMEIVNMERYGDKIYIQWYTYAASNVPQNRIYVYDITNNTIDLLKDGATVIYPKDVQVVRGVPPATLMWLNHNNGRLYIKINSSTFSLCEYDIATGHVIRYLAVPDTYTGSLGGVFFDSNDNIYAQITNTRLKKFDKNGNTIFDNSSSGFALLEYAGKLYGYYQILDATTGAVIASTSNQFLIFAEVDGKLLGFDMQSRTLTTRNPTDLTVIQSLTDSNFSKAQWKYYYMRKKGNSVLFPLTKNIVTSNSIVYEEACLRVFTSDLANFGEINFGVESAAVTDRLDNDRGYVYVDKDCLVSFYRSGTSGGGIKVKLLSKIKIL